MSIINKDLNIAFTLAASLLNHQTYRDLTQRLIDMFHGFNGVTCVKSYEVFGDSFKLSGMAHASQGIMLERIPANNTQNSAVSHEAVVKELITFYGEGTHSLLVEGHPVIVTMCKNDLGPRRIIVIEGAVSEYEMDVIRGLSLIYKHQVTLLDSKERDPLTQLRNRQSLNILLGQVIDFFDKKEPAKSDKLSWLAVLDIDHFKQINDQYGHVYGDEVLIHFAELMKKNFRYSDFMFRFGGEEFIVILNQTNQAGAELALERFRKNVEAFKFPFKNITVSIGYTKIRTKTPQATLIEYADAALYQAKEAGRNQTVYKESTESDRVNKGGVELF